MVEITLMWQLTRTYCVLDIKDKYIFFNSEVP